MNGYMIHACKSRMWYVERFLLPSLKDQGIAPEIWLDNGKGNLLSCLDSFKSLPSKGETWHLQDDVVVCSDFAKRSMGENLPICQIVCGFYAEIDSEIPFSFPCIRIPNRIAHGFVEWFETTGKTKYKSYAESGKMDDTFFRLYLQENPCEYIVLSPCLVDHIDFLIGGSVCKHTRQIRAAAFEAGTVEKLERKIKGYQSDTP